MNGCTATGGLEEGSVLRMWDDALLLAGCCGCVVMFVGDLLSRKQPAERSGGRWSPVISQQGVLHAEFLGSNSHKHHPTLTPKMKKCPKHTNTLLRDSERLEIPLETA